MKAKRPDIRGKAIKALVDDLKTAPCRDCGGTFPPEAMDFDHLPGTDKLGEIGKLVSGRYSWDLVKAEVAKCDLVCSNCHRVRSRTRLNSDDPPFVPFPKIARWNREVTVTEKIDGTNAVVVITGSGDVLPGSKSRWLRPKLHNYGSDPDNYGFAAWVASKEEQLFEELGVGVHAGEWWGQGIGRKYGLAEKRFWLFNTHRWNDASTRPACCGVVPILWKGNAKDLDIPSFIEKLNTEGSVAVPGWMKPEGIVVFHHAADICFKVLCEGDELPKGVTTRKERETAVKLGVPE